MKEYSANVDAKACLSPREGLPRDFRLYQLREQGQRFLPAQVAHLGGDHGGDPFLHDG
jgi:hypothetical protein